MIFEIIVILLIMGVIFNLLGSIGVLRFPDVYTRLHAGTNCATLGVMGISLAVIVYGLYSWHTENNMKYITMAAHTLIALILLMVTNPVGSHAIAKSAHKSGVMPKFAIVDALEEDSQKDD